MARNAGFQKAERINKDESEKMGRNGQKLIEGEF
jgi:hypothetical protein